MHFCLTLTLSFVLFPFTNSYPLAFLLKPFSFLPSHSLSFPLHRRFSLCCHNNRQQPGPGWALLPFSLKIQPHVKAFVFHSFSLRNSFPSGFNRTKTLLCMWPLSSLSHSLKPLFSHLKETQIWRLIIPYWASYIMYLEGHATLQASLCKCVYLCHPGALLCNHCSAAAPPGPDADW